MTTMLESVTAYQLEDPQSATTVRCPERVGHISGWHQWTYGISVHGFTTEATEHIRQCRWCRLTERMGLDTGWHQIEAGVTA